MWRETPGRVKAGVAFAASLAFTLACGGKSSRDATNSEGGAENQVSGGSAGQLSTSGGAAGTASGAGSGATAGSPTGGAGGSCLLPDGDVPRDARRCLVDSDCATLTVNTCCSEDRVLGVTKYPDCTVAPTRCDPQACDKPTGFVTDDGAKTLDRSELRVSCQFKDPGPGRCRSLVADVDAVVCGAAVCTYRQVCVRLSPRGGPAPRCLPLPDDGVCPQDTEYTGDCDGRPGCRELLLTPPPYCATVPSSCRGPLRCACLPPDICALPQVCTGAMGADVYCQDLSP